MTSTAIPSSRAVTSSPVVVALDYDNRDKALAFVDRIDPRDCRLKVGKEMFTLLGPQFVRDLHQRGFEVLVILFASVRYDGKSIADIAREEISKLAGFGAMRLTMVNYKM